MSHGCWGSAQACRVNFEPKFNPANSKDYHKTVDKLPENLMRKAMEILHEMNEKEDVSLNPWVYKEEGTFEVGICKKNGQCNTSITDARYSIWIHKPQHKYGTRYDPDFWKITGAIMSLQQKFYNAGFYDNDNYGSFYL